MQAGRGEGRMAVGSQMNLWRWSVLGRRLSTIGCGGGAGCVSGKAGAMSSIDSERSSV